MDRLTAIYHLAAEAFEIEARAQALAVEQSVERPLAAIAAPHVHAEIVGRVDSIEPDPQGGFVVRLALSVATTGFEIGQLLNMLFGNSSIQETVRLLDVELPAALRDACPGPRFGIEGLRQLTGARHR
ncbi:MAG: ribulose 1,5-bisphosphate carboxylase, partial [Rhodospirillales bacterium]|nr:ribulose 1,5-bisphosphate carboxylase [Rhodospirillales bacterium]